MANAYLVAHLDVSKEPAVVVGAAIYSESANQLTRARDEIRFIDVTYGVGESFEEAERDLRKFLKRSGYDRHFAWAAKFLEAKNASGV